MSVRGNQSRFQAVPFRTKRFPGQGYAIVDDTGDVVSAFTKDRAAAEVACEAKVAAAQRATKVITRPCLRCGKDFQSKGIHNRMCGDCRHTGSAEADPVGYSFGSMTGRRRA